MPRLLILISCLFMLGCVEQDILPIDWNPSFESQDKHPYGLYVLKNQWEQRNENFVVIEQPTTSYFNEFILNRDEFDLPYSSNTYTLIEPELMSDSVVWEQYEEFVGQGGNVFLSTHSINQSFTNYAGITITSLASNTLSARLFTVKSHYKEQNFNYKKGLKPTFFNNVEAREDIDVLGYIQIANKKYPNYIRLAFGDGYFYLHTSPYAFTNYHMLESDHYKYVLNCLSFLPSGRVHWDNHSRFYRQEDVENEGGFFSSLRFVLGQKSLRIAFYILVALGGLALLFNYKRRKPIQSTWVKPQNKRIILAQTLSNLYKKNDDHAQLTQTQANYFLHFIGEKYGINYSKLDETFTQQLRASTKVKMEKCSRITQMLESARANQLHSQKQFLALNQHIEYFLIKIE